MALAGAVAFGLGNRELAGRITREWYARRGGPPRYNSTSPQPGSVDERIEERRDLGSGEKNGPAEYPHH
jgi:hypothetical protein